MPPSIATTPDAGPTVPASPGTRLAATGPPALVVAGCVWVVLVGLLVGPLLTEDSESYVVLADSLARQHTYAAPYVEASSLSLPHQGEGYNPPAWPPGYPALVALLVLATGLPTAAAASWVALAAAVVCVVLTHRLCRSVGCGPWPAALGAACFAVAPGTNYIVPYAWSETLFVIPVLLTLICLAQARQMGRRQALWVGLLTAAAVLTRYLGVGLILTVAVCLLRRTRGEKAARRLGLLALGAGLPAGAMAGWFVRNRLVTGSFTGYQLPPCDGFLVNAGQALRALAPLLAGPHQGREALWGLLALSLLVLAVTWAWERRRIPLEPASARGVCCALLFVAAYLLWAAIARTRTGVSPIQVRYAWPVLPALIGGGIGLLQPLWSTQRRSWLSVAAASCALLVILACGGLTVRELYQVERPQVRLAAAQRAALVQSPEVQTAIRKKAVLFVGAWPLAMRALATTAAKVWFMSPYVYGISDFHRPGLWRDWFQGIDVILTFTPLPAVASGEWTQTRVGETACLYERRR